MTATLVADPPPRMPRPVPSPAQIPPLLAGPGRVLVTGGAGFVGSHLVGELLCRGHRVRVVDDLSTGSLGNLAEWQDDPRVDVVVASIDDPQVAARACDGVLAAFHLAGAVGVARLAARPLEMIRRNLRGTEELLAAAAARGVPVLFTSSSEVYGDGPVPFVESEAVRPGSTEGSRGGYACAKLMGEWLAFGHRHEQGLPVVVARLFNTVGPRQSGESGMVLPRFVAQALAGQPLTVYGDGRQTRCFAHVRDVVRALVDLAEVPGAAGRVYNVGSDRETTVLALAELVQREVGAEFPAAIELRPWASVFPPGFVDPPRRAPCLQRLRAAIGWAPATPVEAIVRELVALGRAGRLPLAAALG